MTWTALKQKFLSKILIQKFKESNNGILNLFNKQRGNLLLSGLPMNSKWIQNIYDSWNLDDIWRNRINLADLYDAVFAYQLHIPYYGNTGCGVFKRGVQN